MLAVGVRTGALKISLSSRAVSPVWLECASSTIIGIPTFADFRLPSLGLRLLFGSGGLLRLGPGGAEQPAQYEWEFLERGDDDFGAVDEGVGELLAVLVDCLDHALGVFDLVNCVLELLV